MQKKRVSLFYPHNRFLIAYLSFLSAFAPISTDMYLPALPGMAQSLNASSEMVSATISMFLLVFALSMLFWGPISDRYGRRPVLIAGSLLYVISSVAISLSQSIWPLLLWRCVQALGSGAASAMSLAIVKDVLRGSSMEKVVSIMQAAVIVAPLTAPVIGGWMLLFLSWRGIFWCLSICGALAFAGALALAETAPLRSAPSLAGTFRGMGTVLANRNFLYPLLLFSAMAMPFMSYLALSAFIFQDQFHLSAQSYSLFFSFNAGMSLLGPFAHYSIFRHHDRRLILSLHLLIMGLAGLALLLAGFLGPWTFALLFAPVSFCGSAMRPPSTVLMMESIDGNNGLVASLINCGGLLCGSLSMFIASLPFWPGPIAAVAWISLATSAVCLACWLRIGRKGKQGLPVKKD